MKRLLSLVAVPLIAFGSAHAFADEAASHWHLEEPSRIEWRDQEARRLPCAAALASKTGASNCALLGSGDTFDTKKAKALEPGTYSSMPPRMTHFAWMTGEAVLQLSTLGPWSITYVNPDDDPRAKPGP